MKTSATVSRVPKYRVLELTINTPRQNGLEKRSLAFCRGELGNIVSAPVVVATSNEKLASASRSLHSLPLSSAWMPVERSRALF